MRRHGRSAGDARSDGFAARLHPSPRDPSSLSGRGSGSRERTRCREVRCRRRAPLSPTTGAAAAKNEWHRDCHGEPGEVRAPSFSLRLDMLGAARCQQGGRSSEGQDDRPAARLAWGSQCPGSPGRRNPSARDGAREQEGWAALSRAIGGRRPDETRPRRRADRAAGESPGFLLCSGSGALFRSGRGAAAGARWRRPDRRAGFPPARRHRRRSAGTGRPAARRPAAAARRRRCARRR